MRASSSRIAAVIPRTFCSRFTRVSVDSHIAAWRQGRQKRGASFHKRLSFALTDRLSDGGEKLNDLHRLLFFVHLAFHFYLLSHLALGHVGIADLADLAFIAHKHHVPTLVVGGAVGVAGGVA